MWTVVFWKETADRAVKTGSQFLLGFWFVDKVNITGVQDFDLVGGAGIFLAGAILSLLTSIISARVNQRGTASLIQ